MASQKRVLCCAECEQPLRRTADGGAYCDHCGYPPSMQDTFIKLVPAEPSADQSPNPAGQETADDLCPRGRRPPWLPKEEE